MHYFRLVIGALASLFLGSALAGQPTPVQGVPALKVTAPNGQTSILIGSFHSPHRHLRQPAATALTNARRYVVESTPDTADRQPAKNGADLIAPEVLVAVLQGKKGARASWAASLTDAQVETLRRNWRCQLVQEGMASVNAEETFEVILISKSAAWAADLAIKPCASDGLLSRDALLQRAAERKGLKPFSGLESQASVQGQRDAVPERIYRYQLYKAFTPEWRIAIEQTVQAINTGAYDTILEAMQSLDESPADSAIFYKLMVADRNRAWMPNLARYLDEGGAFINVGAAHLPGPEGLIALLQAHGYRVDSIVLPAATAK